MYFGKQRILSVLTALCLSFTVIPAMASYDVTAVPESLDYSSVFLIRSVMLSPNYKGLISEENGHNDIRTQIRVDESALSDGNVLSVYLNDRNDNVIFYSHTDKPDKLMYSVFSSETLAPGDYTLTVELASTVKGEILDKELHTVRKHPGAVSGLSVYVDKYGRYIKNGRPHFYIGMYGAPYTNTTHNYSQLENVGSDGGVDGFLSYWQGVSGTYSDTWYQKLHEHGFGNIANMRLFYESSGDRVNFKLKSTESEGPLLAQWTQNQLDYPALDLYYIGDEEAPELSDKLKWHSDIISSHDITRPTLFVDWRADSDNGFSRSAVADITGIDYYPITNTVSNIGVVGSRLRSYGKYVKNRPLFMVLQCANYDAINGNLSHDKSKLLPTYTQLANMAMQAVCAGATGIMWYSYYYLMADPAYSEAEKTSTLEAVKSINRTVKSYSDIIFSLEEAPEVSAVLENGDEFKNYTVKHYNGKTYIFAVNTSECIKNIKFTLPQISLVKKIWGSENSILSFMGDELTFSADGLGYVIAEIEHEAFKSADCSVHNLCLTKGGAPVLYCADENTGDIYAAVPAGDADVNFEFELPEGAVFYKDGIISATDGSLKGDFAEFTVAAENNTENKFTINYRTMQNETPGFLGSAEQSEDMVSVNGTVYGKGILCMAAYDDQNTLKSIDFENLTYAKSKEVFLETEKTDGMTVKVYLWKDDLKIIDYEIIK